MYVAFADLHGMPFAPDTARHPVVEGIYSGEEQFRGRLRATLNRTSAETTPGDRELLRQVPPLAAVVFERARSSGSISSELFKLRNELAPNRDTIGDLENEMLFSSGDAAMKAQTKWNQVLVEVERNFGLEPRIVTSKAVLQLGVHLGEAVTNPLSLKAWLSVFANLPAEGIKRLHARRTMIELHRLRPELPAAERLRRSLHIQFDIR